MICNGLGSGAFSWQKAVKEAEQETSRKEKSAVHQSLVRGKRKQSFHTPDVLHIVEKKNIQQSGIFFYKILFVHADKLSAAVEIFPVNAKEMFPVLLLSVRKPEQSLKRAEHPVQVKRTGEIQPEVHIIEFHNGDLNKGYQSFLH